MLVRVTVRTTGRDVAQPAAADANNDAAPAIAPLVRDLRLSVEVNPAATAGYRVIGYENAPSSWGEWSGRTDNLIMPAGRTFTALLEVVPTGQTLPASTAPAVRKYRKPDPIVVTSTELLTVAVEYGQGPMAEPGKIDLPISIEARAIELASPEFRTAAAAAALGMSLRHSQPYNEPTLSAAVKLLSDVTATEPTEDRQMLLDISKRIEAMNPHPPSDAPMPGPFEKDDGTPD
jgi:Ca-activated chloride channel family protein